MVNGCVARVVMLCTYGIRIRPALCAPGFTLRVLLFLAYFQKKQEGKEDPKEVAFIFIE